MTATVRGISPADREGTETPEDKTYSVIYKVSTDDKNDGPETVLQAFGLPAVGDLYTSGNDFNSDAVVIGRDPRQGASPTEWEVEVTYSTDVATDPTEQQDNPLLQPADVTYSFVDRNSLIGGKFSSPEAPPEDREFDEGVLAPNNEPFVPQPEIEVSDAVVSITRNMSSLPDLLSINNAVNSTFFFGARPRTLRIKASATRQWSKKTGFYWQVTYQIQHRWETWDIQLVNVGSFYWDGGLPDSPTASSSLKVPFLDRDGNPKLGLLSTDGDKSDSVTFTRIQRRQLDFNSLGIL